MAIKAVAFDLFDTLIKATADNEACLRGIHDCLCKNGADASYEAFLDAYRSTRTRQRKVRQTEQREVTNITVVCETAKLLGCELRPESQAIREAVRAYFRPWELQLMAEAMQTLEALRPLVKLGLASNFTDVSFVEEALGVLGIGGFFDSIVVSAGCGWRKPNPRIFQALLDGLGVRPGECLFVGDDLEGDVKGSKRVGMLAALLATSPTPVNSKEADFVIGSLEELVPIVGRLT